MGLVAVVLSNGHDGLIRTYFESSPKSADAGQTINFYLESKYHPGYPASLEDDEVRFKKIPPTTGTTLPSFKLKISLNKL